MKGEIVQRVALNKDGFIKKQSPSCDEAKETELTFIVTMDGIKKGAAKTIGGEAPAQFLGPEEGSQSFWQ